MNRVTFISGVLLLLLVASSAQACRPRMRHRGGVACIPPVYAPSAMSGQSRAIDQYQPPVSVQTPVNSPPPVLSQQPTYDQPTVAQLPEVPQIPPSGVQPRYQYETGTTGQTAYYYTYDSSGKLIVQEWMDWVFRGGREVGMPRPPLPVIGWFQRP